MTQPAEQPVQTANDEPVDDESEFEPLKGFEEDYEIQKEFPFVIKNKKTGRILKDTINKTLGYVQVKLNGKSVRKHVILAKQFIPNDDPEHKTQVDHISHDRADNRLQNLRWISPSENCRNRTVSTANTTIKYEFVDDIPDDVIVVDFYDTKTERREFEDGKYYYYHNETNDEDKFYGRITDNLYKILHINTNKSGNESIRLIDINNKPVSVYINRFKFQHDLL